MKPKIVYPEEVILVSKFAKALSHPLRAFIMQKISKQNSCCYSGDIALELNIGRSTLSQHLKELKYAGLIQGETEPPFIKYCVNRENFTLAKQYFTTFFAE